MDGPPLNTCEVTVKLTRNGKYLWSITNVFSPEDIEGGTEKIRKIDTLLKEKFPNYQMTGSGRSADIRWGDE